MEIFRNSRVERCLIECGRLARGSRANKVMEIMDEDAEVQRIAELDQNADGVMEEKLDHLTQQLVSQAQQIAALVEENASAGNTPISNGSKGGFCKHSCAHHKELMDPAVWSNLPKCISQMVSSRLPLTQIIHLQCLSKEWCRIAKESDLGSYVQMLNLIPRCLHVFLKMAQSTQIWESLQ